jgi:ubiquitin carboxyl-terminal hydrolase 10
MSEWQQEDSHEYFMSLLSRLQEDSTPKGHKLNESTIYDIFGGLLNQSVTCKSCGHVSKTNQEFYDLSLHLGNSRKNSQTGDGNSLPQEEETVKQRYSIQKSINDFFSPELIKTDKSDKSGYVCENCKKRTNAIKISSIDRAPETLLVHLKRFRFNGSSSSKVKQGVSYPSMLDLSQYTTNDDNVLYELISVVVHEGRSVSSGHYIAHCRQPDGTWATHDDEYINAITEKQALRDPSAYYLVYTRLTSKEHKLATDTSKSMEPTLSPVRAKAPMNSTTKPLKSFVATPKSKISVNSPKVKKRLGIIGHQPTNNLNNIGNKTLKKKYSQKSKKIGSKRLRKY